MRMKPTRIDAKVATQFMFHTHLHLKWQCILYVDDGLPFAEVELLETRSCLTMIQSTSCLFVLFISKSLVARCSCWCWSWFWHDFVTSSPLSALKIGTVTSTSYRIEILALKNRICSAATHFPPGKGPPFGKTIAEDPRERERSKS